MPNSAENELQLLTSAVLRNPNDTHLLNKIALLYFNNWELKKEKEDYDYFEKAYLTEKTITSCHNFAWFLFFEWSEVEWRWSQDNAIEKAIQIQKECLEMKPLSYFPYYLMGYMLLHMGKAAEALPYFSQAYALSSKRQILHAEACCYYLLEDLAKAKECFAKSALSDDQDGKSRYNLALCEFELGNREEVKSILKSIKSEITSGKQLFINGFDLAQLYFLMGEYELASNESIEAGLHYINLLDWNHLSYCLYLTNRALWVEALKNRIELYKAYLTEFEAAKTQGDQVFVVEDNELLGEWKKHIESIQHLLDKGMEKPVLEAKKLLQQEYCGCLLFDCPNHKNPADDWVLSKS